MPQDEADVFSLLSEQVREIISTFGMEIPTEPQRIAIPLILGGKNVMLVAPTGSGKTEAAVLPVMSRLSQEKPEDGVCLLYITPLRALNRDMVRRLSSWCGKLGLRIGLRHGDTPQSERRKQQRTPPHVLITTPETLQAMLVNRSLRAALANLRCVIVDEVHQIAENRRGVQLSVGLERLRELTSKDFQRIGLSATVGDPPAVAELICGKGRLIEIAESKAVKGYSYWVDWPQPSEEDFENAALLYTTPEAAARISRIKELSEFHTSTLIFVNSRQVAEMVTLKLSSIGKGFGIHHGSLSREERERAEADFRTGRLKAIVCTSTLELGIDIGSVDLVVQYLSPRQVSALIQRVGRSGHRLDLSSKGVTISGYVDDAMESLAAIWLAERGDIERPMIHKGALDVLANQIVGMAFHRPNGLELGLALEILRRTLPYSDLDQGDFQDVAQYLDVLGLVIRRENRLLLTRKGGLYYLKNISMIRDERRYTVWDISSETPIGSVGDEFVETKARVGLNFICRGAVWRIESVSQDGRVLVTPVEDPTAALPGWDGEMLPLSPDVAKQVGFMRRSVAEMLSSQSMDTCIGSLSQIYPADRYAIEKIVELIAAQVSRGAPVASDKLILAEGFENFLVVNWCSGEKANRSLGLVLEARLSKLGIVRHWWCDGYRILFELAVDTREQRTQHLVRKALHISSEGLRLELQQAVEERYPLGYYMKFVAERFGATERGLFLSEESLAELVRDFRGTPIYRETLREVMLEKVDLPHLLELASSIESGEVELSFLFSEDSPTPISSPILYRFAELPELMYLDLSKTDVIDRARNAILGNRVSLICLNCGNAHEPKIVRELSERPTCLSCGSFLLAPVRRQSPELSKLAKKRMANERLSQQETEQLSRTRRAADVVLSYGKRGVMALCVYGVGPQTASKILSKMQYEDRELIRDLLEAKLRYVQTRPFWD